MNLNENLKKLRKAAGMTLDQLSEKSGVSKPYLWQLENEEDKKPSAEILFKISEALDSTIAELMGYPVTVRKKTMKNLDPVLKKFVKAKQQELDLSDEDVKMLAGIELRGKKPKTIEDWEFIYQSIKRSIK